jgi:hypothetical protein
VTTFPSVFISHGSPLVLHELGIVEVRTQGLEGHYRALLVGPDQPRVTDHVSSHNGGEATLNRISS